MLFTVFLLTLLIFWALSALRLGHAYTFFTFDAAQKALQILDIIINICWAMPSYSLAFP